MERARDGDNPILLRYWPSPRKKMTGPFTRRRSDGTLPKYASFTTGPIVESSPATNGIVMVVLGDGANIPRIHTDTSPELRCHRSRPAFVIVLDDSNPPMRTSRPSSVPRWGAKSAGPGDRP